MRITIGLVIVLSGCATATPLKTGNGNQYLIECDGSAVPISTCYKKANTVCASGWDLVDKDGSLVPFGSATADITYIGAIEKKSITVQCR